MVLRQPSQTDGRLSPAVGVGRIGSHRPGPHPGLRSLALAFSLEWWSPVGPARADCSGLLPRALAWRDTCRLPPWPRTGGVSVSAGLNAPCSFRIVARRRCARDSRVGPVGDEVETEARCAGGCTAVDARWLSLGAFRCPLVPLRLRLAQVGEHWLASGARESLGWGAGHRPIRCSSEVAAAPE